MPVAEWSHHPTDTFSLLSNLMYLQAVFGDAQQAFDLITLSNRDKAASDTRTVTSWRAHGPAGAGR